MATATQRRPPVRIRPLGRAIGTFPALLELWEKDGLTQKELVMLLDVEAGDDGQYAGADGARRVDYLLHPG